MIGVIVSIAQLLCSGAQSSYLGCDTLPLREGTAGIHGGVLDALSANPIADLEVLLFEVDAGGVRGPGPRPRSAVTRTDAAGRFSVSQIGAGSYRVRVTGKTHQPICFGGSREEPERCEGIPVDDNQICDVVIFARPAAIIRGRIIGHDGRPMPDASVSTMCLGPEQCLEHTKSDADGRFEIGGIPPGEVALSADFPAGTGGAERAYYPGVWEIDETQPIAVIAGQPVNIDFRLPRAVMGSISARVVGPEGYRLDRFELSQSDQSMQALDGPVVRVDNLREGRYLLHALGSADGKQYAGFKQVDVSEGPVEVFIQLEAAGLINGRIIAEEVGVPLLDGSGISAWWLLDDDVVGAVRVDVSADGSFYFGNIFGERIFKVGLAKGWRVVSIRADGKDVTDDVLHVAPGSRTQLTITVGRQ
ncbi:MAG: carboxypeptidase-like regulatory domain-containing protein [Acidobacteriota bacterium]|nr:carboxypeptidase-like regulatory domain-containing protein [Acidobacteriota bacterium]